MRKFKAKKFEAETKKWAWSEAREVLQQKATFSEIMSAARELSDFVLGERTKTD